MNRSLSLMLCIVMTTVACSQGQDAAEHRIGSASTIRQVTLYRDRALVTREIAVPPGESVRSVVVADLPISIVPDSVHAEGSDATLVRSVRVSSRWTGELPQDETERWDQQAAELNRKMEEVQHEVDSVSADIEALEQMVNFAAAAGKSDLDRGVLNAETLTSLSTFSMTQRRELASELFQGQRQLKELEREMQAIQDERSRASGRLQTKNYEAEIVVEAPQDVAGTVRLNYLVDGCGWSPQYTVHGHWERDRVEMRYSALVHQASGEDWDEVEFVLSTASPAVSAARPLLASLEVSAVEPSSADIHGDPFGSGSVENTSLPEQAASLNEMLHSLRSKQQQAEATLNGDRASESPKQRDLALNALAGQLQQIELQAESQSWRNLAPDAGDDVATQVYSFGQPISLESQTGQQVVQILEFELAGDMYHVATPLLSSFAYREVQVTNDQPVGLLGGPAAIYLGDRFVGRVQIPSTASGQRITIGFGADPQVRTRRELTDKREVLKGGNRLLTFEYRLVVANFKDEDVAIRLMDRMPNTRQTQHLAVTFEPSQVALSDDALYRRVLEPAGILRWDLTVPAGHHGSEAFDVDYSYTMEFDRSRVPTTEHSLDELQAQYENTVMPSGMGGMGGGMGGMN